MAVGSIWQFVLKSVSSGEEMLNVFHYQQSTSGTVSGDLATGVNNAFWDSIDAALLAILHPDTTVVSSEALELDFLAATNLKIINSVGTFNDVDSVGVAPSFISAALRYNRSAAGQRYGWKRFGGIPLAALEGNAYETGYGGSLTTLAAVVMGGFTAGTISFVPFVASRPIILGSNPSGRVPPSINPAGVGTQDTRKS